MECPTIEVTANVEKDYIRIVYDTGETPECIYVDSEYIDTLVEKILNAKRRLKGGR